MIEELNESLFRSALRIRLVEEKIIELYPSDLIQSPVHLSIGQEAVAVGVCRSLDREDWVFINYRGHAFYLAKGGNLNLFFAELMGRKTGICGGKGGSMHLAAPEVGVMGSSAVVASTISHAVGAALASKIRGDRRVFVANFGDGATEQGVFHESLNFASLYNLPVLFLCEDNGLAVHSPTKERQAYKLESLVSSYNVKFNQILDTRNPLDVFSVSTKVVEEIRENNSPQFLLAHTARYKEHVGPGEDFDAGYRSVTHIDDWKSKDPLIQETAKVQQYKPGITREIEESVKFALNSPFPGIEDLTSDV